MPHKKIEQISGVPHSGNTKGSPFEHNPHHTAHPAGCGRTEQEFEHYLAGQRGNSAPLQGPMTPTERKLVDMRK